MLEQQEFVQPLKPVNKNAFLLGRKEGRKEGRKKKFYMAKISLLRDTPFHLINRDIINQI